MAETKSPSPRGVLRFGVFQVNLAARELRKHGVRVRLPGQPFCILSMLLEKPGEIVTREEMRERLWASDTFVDFEHSLNSAVKKLRAALGDSPENSRYVETLPRLGYRFVAQVEEVSKTQLPLAETPANSGPQAAPAAADAKLWGAQRTLSFTVVPATLVVMAVAAGSYFYPRRTLKLTERDTVVLADFANHTGDQIFDDTLKTALSVSLRQSPFLSVLPDDDVAKTLQQMTRPASTRLTPEVTRELCQRAGSKAYVAGSIASLGSEYVLGLKAVNCQNGNTLAEDQVTAASKEKVLDALGQAASKLRGELGESLATVQKFDVPLVQATTSSLEALKEFSLAFRPGTAIDLAAAEAYDKRAIEFDPNFALAYLAVGLDYENLGELERAREYLSKAFALREHASEWEKLFIAGEYYSAVTGELDKGARTYREMFETYPRTPRGYVAASATYSSLGQYEKAVDTLRQGLRLRADLPFAHGNLCLDLLALQRFDEARQTAREGQARKVDDFNVNTALYAKAFLEGDSTAMAEQQEWFAGKPEYEDAGLALSSDTEAYVGHLGKARELTRRSVESAIRAGHKESAAVLLEKAALREVAMGNAQEAKQAATRGLSIAHTSRGAELEGTLTFAMAGDTERAKSLARDLNKRFPLDTQVQSLWLPVVQARLALNGKNTAGALSSLEIAAPIELATASFENCLSCLYPVYVRGEAYLAAGQGSAAAAEFQKILDHNGIVWNCWTGALAHLGLARANVLQWRTSRGADADSARVRALSAYKAFLTLWKDADPNIPILRQAKAEYAKLPQ